MRVFACASPQAQVLNTKDLVIYRGAVKARMKRSNVPLQELVPNYGNHCGESCVGREKINTNESIEASSKQKPEVDCYKDGAGIPKMVLAYPCRTPSMKASALSRDTSTVRVARLAFFLLC
jgi:hypothetical protein